MRDGALAHSVSGFELRVSGFESNKPGGAASDFNPEPGTRHPEPALSLARASLATAGLMGVLPFLQPYHRFPLTSFYSEWLAFALGLAAALLLLKKALWREMALPAVALAPLGLILLLGLQVALERVPYPEQALTATLYLLWVALLIVLAHALRRELGLAVVAETLAWFVLAGGLLGALAGLLQHYQFSTPLDFLVARKGSAAVYGNLGQPNHYAAYMTLALASAIYLYGRGRLHGALAGACAALLLLMLGLSGSRSPWLYLGALTLLALLLHGWRGDTESRRLAEFTLWLLPAFVVAQWAATLPFLTPEKGLLVTSAQRLFEMASGIEARLQLWQEAWDMFLAAPALGSGWGKFAWHHFLYLASTGATAAPGVFNHAHNIVLQLLAETGVTGALLVVGAAIAWAADLRNVKFDLEWWWLLALLAVMGIHSMLEFPLWYAYFLGLAALLLGLGAQRAITLRFAGAARLVAALVILAGWVNLLAVLGPYRDFERLVFLPERRSSPQLEGTVFAESIARVHREPLLAPYVELAVAYGITPSAERLQEKLDLNARAMHFAPVDVVVYRQALLLALAGERAAAVQQLEHSARVYPAELDNAVSELGELARRRPGEFAPLLELAAAKSAERRARGATR